ncbi:MAG: ABC transporter permease [Acidimicrobiia bacterium]|nr:ABC transporter permease [Acidimicrobiia bacterium]MDH4306498.1 ABC transporter permease [Acidimicrobiia bacterium]MDH5292654.1 ABC transporter permease [Acidimicrobiia bacterium]
MRQGMRRIRQTSVAFLRAAIVEDMSYPMSLVLSQLGVVVPIFISFFIADLVGESAEVGGDYLTFATVGLAMSSALQSTLQGFGNRLQQIQDRGLFESILVEPISWTWMPLGINQWNMIRGFVNAILLLGLGSVLGAKFDWSGLGASLLLMLAGTAAVSAIGILASSLMVLAKRSQPVVVLYGLAASIFGGALFSLSQLPDWLRPVSYLFPHTYVLNGVRSALMEDPGSFVMTVPQALAGLGITTLVIGGVGLWSFRRSLEIARELGLLSGY